MSLIPENAEQIYEYLTEHGLNARAASGILGNIEQESGGDPQAGSMSSGYGLIQWTPGSEYFPNGPATLDQQLPMIISYIDANGSVQNINAHSSTPTEAALYFSNTYERPAAWAANNARREAAAQQVFEAATQNNWKTGTPLGGSNPAPAPTPASSPTATLADKLSTGVSNLGDDAIRAVEVAVGVLLFSFALVGIAVVLGDVRGKMSKMVGTVADVTGAEEVAKVARAKGVTGRARAASKGSGRRSGIGGARSGSKRSGGRTGASQKTPEQRWNEAHDRRGREYTRAGLKRRERERPKWGKPPKDTEEADQLGPGTPGYRTTADNRKARARQERRGGSRSHDINEEPF